uniref:Splicing factor 45 n=1 Tax=Panagrolaimus davidi TaxID=227884 RepID=A0A914QP89_9BILA
MSLYDDIEPTVKRQRTPDRRVSESNKGFAAVNMFAPRTLMTKTTKPPPRTHAPSTLQTIYSDPIKPTPPPSSSTFPTTAPTLVQQQQNPTQIIPQDVREDTEFLFDEVHILDEYQPSKPNSYFEFMKSIGCNPQFGEEIDDFKLEKLIQDEIINGQLEKERSPSPEPEKELVSGTDVAANIMAKMGYTFGSGLGKHGQGMSSALKIEKKGGQAGKIIHETDEVMREVGLNPETFQGPITNILLLRNIYTLDDIPDDYDNELRPELSRYGVIKNLILHRDSEAEDFFDQCRIFVDYPNKAAAIRAYADLNNRYFNGRSIRATFYPTDRFMLGHYFDPSY